MKAVSAAKPNTSEECFIETSSVVGKIAGVPAGRRRRVVLDLPPALAARLALAANRVGSSQPDFIVDILEDAIGGGRA